MVARHAVLLTPSISLRLNQALSCTQITRETPQIPFYVFNSLRTLSFSVSCNLFVCHSYENCRVCTNNSQSGTRYSPISTRLAAARGLVLSAVEGPARRGGQLTKSRICNFLAPFSSIPFSFYILRTLLRNGRSTTPLHSRASALFLSQWGCGGYDPVENSRVSPANYQLSTIDYEPWTPFDLLPGGAILDA